MAEMIDLQGARKELRPLLAAEILEQYFAGESPVRTIRHRNSFEGVLILTVAAAHGDLLTPAIVAVGGRGLRAKLPNTVELFQIL